MGLHEPLFNLQTTFALFLKGERCKLFISFFLKGALCNVELPQQKSVTMPQKYNRPVSSEG